MKFLFTIALAILFIHSAVAQTNVSVGKPYDVIDSPTKLYFAQGNEVMTVKIEKSGVLTIQKFNSDKLALTSLKSYDDFPKSSMLEKVLRLHNRYFVFYSLYNNEKEELHVREIDFKSGKFTSAGLKILSVKQKITGDLTVSGFFNYNTGNKYSFYHNSDSSKTLVTYRLRPETKSDKKNFDVLGLSVFDQELGLMWSNEVTMPYTEKKMNVLDYAPDKNGNAYIVARIFDDNTTKEKDKEGNPNYSIEIFKIDSSGKLTKNPVNIPDKFVQTLWAYENPKGFMVCAGFYNKGKETANADGIIVINLDNNGKQSSLNLYEIPVAILNQYRSAKSQRKNLKKNEDGAAEFTDLKLTEVIFNKDGSMLLIGEQVFSITKSSYSQTSGHSSYTMYFFNDILATKVDPAGKMAWMRKLPKQQKSGTPYGGLSYKYLSGPGAHYFLFLDNEKNRSLALDDVPEPHVDGQGGFLTYYKIDDETSKVTKSHVLDVRDVKGMEVFQFQPKRIVATKPNEAVVEVYKKKKEDVLIKIAF
jgi:hypothetical protein